MSILFESEGGIAILTIDRPKVHNALDFETSDALVDAWTRFRDETTSCGVAMLTGAGERAFCAGADLRGVGDFYRNLTSAERLRRSRTSPRSRWHHEEPVHRQTHHCGGEWALSGGWARDRTRL